MTIFNNFDVSPLGLTCVQPTSSVIFPPPGFYATLQLPPIPYFVTRAPPPISFPPQPLPFNTPPVFCTQLSPRPIFHAQFLPSTNPNSMTTPAPLNHLAPFNELYLPHSSTSGSNAQLSPFFSLTSAFFQDNIAEPAEDDLLMLKEFATNDLKFVHVPGEFIGSVELAALIHHNLFGAFVAPPKWISGRRGAKFDKIVLLRLECTDFCFKEESGVLDVLSDLFGSRCVPLKPAVTQRNEFWREITTVTLNPLKMKIMTNGDPLANGHTGKRAEYLVTLDEMLQYGFPLKSTAHFQIVPTKERYQRVTDASPIFVIDCEMCVTSAGKTELTRVSMINEAGEVLLDTLVKPYNEIVNYVTEFSGITEHMMRGVTTRLSDVQRAIREILPEDAILCGHSIEGDLHHLKMKHPYCIDTSLQFNMTGTTKQRTKLRTLCATFLGRSIQGAAGGHCSIEDCAATLELLQLKMKMGKVFGNVLRGWDRKAWLKENEVSPYSSSSSTSASTSNAFPTSNATSFCADCGAHLRVACPATDACLCRMRRDMSTRCVRCAGDVLFRAHISCRAYERTLPNIEEANTFDFEEVILTDNMPEQANMDDCLAFTSKRVLFNADNPGHFVPENARCCLVDTAGQRLPQLPQDLTNFDVSLLEKDCRANAPNELINAVSDIFCSVESGTLVLAVLTAANGAMFGAIA